MRSPGIQSCRHQNERAGRVYIDPACANSNGSDAYRFKFDAICKIALRFDFRSFRDQDQFTIDSMLANGAAYCLGTSRLLRNFIASSLEFLAGLVVDLPDRFSGA